MDSVARGRPEVEVQLKLAQAKLRYLGQIDPLLIDVSLREPCFGAAVGHTLQNKLDLLPLIDEFRIKDRIIATLDYQIDDHVQVEDDFCLHLKKTGYDMRNCFALTAMGTTAGGVFTPDLSMRKLVDYAIPNTMHELVLLPKNNPEQVLTNLSAGIAWLRQHLKNVAGVPCRIYVNILDLIDAFMADSDWACSVLERLATEQVDGLSFEDGRGTYFPFQVGAVVGAAKALLRPEQKVLFHAHTGNGMENASALEALLQGCDGYWGGLERESSTIGHASLGDLIANLMRAGNEHMTSRYKVQRLLPICEQMHMINTGKPTPDDWPISGANAYRQVLSDFAQRADRKMDLPPAAIGGTYRYRIAPVGSDVAVIQARVQEALAISIDKEVARSMILLMREDLRKNLRLAYDEPVQLRELYRRATS